MIQQILNAHISQRRQAKLYVLKISTTKNQIGYEESFESGSSKIGEKQVGGVPSTSHTFRKFKKISRAILQQRHLYVIRFENKKIQTIFELKPKHRNQAQAQTLSNPHSFPDNR